MSDRFNDLNPNLGRNFRCSLGDLKLPAVRSERMRILPVVDPDDKQPLTPRGRENELQPERIINKSTNANPQSLETGFISRAEMIGHEINYFANRMSKNIVDFISAVSPNTAETVKFVIGDVGPVAGLDYAVRVLRDMAASPGKYGVDPSKLNMPPELIKALGEVTPNSAAYTETVSAVMAKFGTAMKDSGRIDNAAKIQEHRAEFIESSKASQRFVAEAGELSNLFAMQFPDKARAILQDGPYDNLSVTRAMLSEFRNGIANDPRLMNILERCSCTTPEEKEMIKSFLSGKHGDDLNPISFLAIKFFTTNTILSETPPSGKRAIAAAALGALEKQVAEIGW